MKMRRDCMRRAAPYEAKNDYIQADRSQLSGARCFWGAVRLSRRRLSCLQTPVLKLKGSEGCKVKFFLDAASPEAGKRASGGGIPRLRGE